MAAEALLDANLRLAETPEFELSDTDRLGLFVVSRLAQRQNVRVSLQPSPYGGTTAVVFIPDALLTDDVRHQRHRRSASTAAQPADGRAQLPGGPRPAALDPGAGLARRVCPPTSSTVPWNWRPRSGLDAAGADFPGALDDEDSERGGLFRAAPPATAGAPGEQHQQAPTSENRPDRAAGAVARGADAERARPLPRRGRPSSSAATRRRRHPNEASVSSERTADARRRAGPRAGRAASHGADPGSPGADRPDADGRERRLPRRRAGPAARRARCPSAGGRARRRPAPARPRARPAGDAPRRAATPLPRRVRQASLAPQLKDGPERRRPSATPTRATTGRPRRARRRRGPQPDGLAPARLAARPRGERRGRRGPGRHSTENDIRGTVDDRTEGRRAHGAPDQSGELNWLLDDLVERVASIRKALVLSGDGLPTGVSKDLTREDSEHLAAVASGFHSLAKGVGRHFEAGSVRQTVVELDDAFLFVTAAGDGSCLAVLSDADSDVGQVAYEMTLAGQAGRRASGRRSAHRSARGRVVGWYERRRSGDATPLVRRRGRTGGPSVRHDTRPHHQCGPAPPRPDRGGRHRARTRTTPRRTRRCPRSTWTSSGCAATRPQSVAELAAGTRPADRRGTGPHRRPRRRGNGPCDTARTPCRAAGREYSARRDQRPPGALSRAEAGNGT